MGSAEMLVVGLTDLMATDLRVSVAAAGTLVTANALGLAVGGPLLTLLTTRFDRRAAPLLGAQPLGVALAVVGLGVFAMGMAPSLQHRVVTLPRPGAPTDVHRARQPSLAPAERNSP